MVIIIDPEIIVGACRSAIRFPILRVVKALILNNIADNGAIPSFEQKLCQVTDKLQGHMDAVEYKHVALGLIFLECISDTFQERYEALRYEKCADPEDRDEYLAKNVF